MIYQKFFTQYWIPSICALAVFFGVLVSIPHVLHTFDDRYQGVPPHLNSDEHLYLARTQQVLCCSADELGVSIGGGELPTLQSGFIEQIYGVIFRLFTNRAATIFKLMDFVVPALLFLVIIGFARTAGVSRERALLIAVLFCVLELYNLGRPIHQRMSFLLTLLSMWGVIYAVRSRWWGVATGVLLGLLVGVYFWSWTAAWCWWGVVLVYHCLIREWSSAKNLGLMALVGLVGAAPQLWNMMSASNLENYADAFFRSGIAKSHTPESWVWSGLFFVMAVGSFIYLTKKKETPYIPLLSITAFILLNQHVVHGTRFVFASHYLFVLVLAATCVLIMFTKERTWYALGASVPAAVFLLGIAKDGLHIIGQWRVDASDFAEQHLASSLPVLDELERSVILSDPDTSSFIAAHTQHDVLYTVYMQHELRSHQEIAERFCLTQFPIAPDNRDYDGQRLLVFGAAYDAFDHQLSREELRYQEIQLVENACADVDVDPQEFLERFTVQYVLWDKKRQTDWDVDRLVGGVEQVVSNKDWVLYKRK